jgi:hypothetical protein
LRRVRALVVAAIVALSPMAGADPAGEIVVVVGQDAQFAAALGDALAPAAITQTHGEPPSLGDLPARSREIADRAQASATIWLVPSGAGTTLVSYDRGADRVLVRELPYAPPFTGAQAAEAARIVRTMLRALREAPEVDRGPPPPPPPAPPPMPPEPRLSAGLGAGVWLAAPAASGAVTGTITVAWRPHGLGIAATAAIAPSADVMSATFSGQVRDVAVAVEVRNAIRLAPPWRITPAFGVAVHAIHVSGGVVGGDELDSRRYDPALRSGLTLGYELPAFDVGLAVSADCLLRRQRYEAASEEILVVPRVQAMAGLVIGIRL